jgi:DNA-binding IclR family transcriptional regulator
MDESEGPGPWGGAAGGEDAAGIRALRRAMRILEAFPPAAAAGIAELAAATRLPKTTVHRVLTTLQSEGYVEQEDASGRYRLGLRLAALGQHALAGNPLVAALRPLMRRVLAATGETVLCGTVAGNSVLVLDVLPSSRPIVPLPLPGARAPLHASSIGKVILAHGEPCDRGLTLALPGPLPRFTPRTITDAHTWRQVLREASARGFAVNEEEEIPGISCVAVPVRNGSGVVVAALSVAAPSDRLSPAVQQRVVGILRDAAERAAPRLRGLSSG